MNIMEEPTVESVFGANAGAVWRMLHKNGPSNISDIAKATSLSREEVHGALGWLGRENKIVMTRQARVVFFSLHESELRTKAPGGATGRAPGSAKGSSATGIAMPVAQREERASPKPKKAAKAGRIGASNTTVQAAKKALAFILAELDENREPTIAQVSKASGMHSRQLGKALSSLEVKSRSIRRKGKSAQIYPLDQKARVWELAALDAEGLQKMMQKAIEAGKAEKRERLTVFD